MEVQYLKFVLKTHEIVLHWSFVFKDNRKSLTQVEMRPKRKKKGEANEKDEISVCSR